jgi:hypothetical protein
MKAIVMSLEMDGSKYLTALDDEVLEGKSCPK